MDPEETSGAKPAERASASGRRAPAELQLFCLHLLGGRYAVEASLITEVVRLGPLTRLPAAPPFLRGVFNHRGEVLAALDLHELVGQPPIKVGPTTRAAIARLGRFRVAVLAEGVEGLVSVLVARIEPSPGGGSGSGVAEFVSGVARDARGPIAILDLPRLVETARSRSLGT